MLSLPQTNVYENVQYFYALNLMSFRQFVDETIIIFLTLWNKNNKEKFERGKLEKMNSEIMNFSLTLSLFIGLQS